jgi:CheY-like chemotaxis protein
VPALTGKTVLVIDDDVRNIFAITSALERFEIRVLYADNGKDGLALLEKQPVDVVLMDIMMPEMDGYEVIQRIRAVPRWKDLPVIAVTAKAMGSDREKCILAGATDYIAKPVDMAHLLSVLRLRLAD